MSTGLLVVRATVRADREAEFVEWYAKEHLPYAIQNIPGVIAGRRYELVGSQPSGVEDHEYMIVYDFETADLAQKALASNAVQRGIAEYDRRFGEVSTRTRSVYRLLP